MEIWGKERLYGDSAHFKAVRMLLGLGYKAHHLDEDGEIHYLNEDSLGRHMAKLKRDNIVFS